MDERLKFIARLLDGEQIAGLCREFGISRKTGYKILTRYNQTGLEGLTDRSRRPYRHANQLPAQIETLIVRLKQDKPSWGAPKIRERLTRLYPDVHTPAISTVHAVLDRHGLVKRRTRRRNRAEGTKRPTTLTPSQRRFWTRFQGVSRSRLGSRLTPIGSQCGRRSTVLRGSMRAVSVQFSFHAALMISLSRRALRSRPHTHDKTEVRPTGTECGSV